MLANLLVQYDILEVVEIVIPTADENRERVRPGYCCVYLSYFTSYGLYFPLPRILVEYIAEVGLCLT